MISDTISLLFVDLITNHHFSFVHKHNLVEFIKFFFQHSFSFFSEGFEILDELVHEISVLLIVPSVVMSVEQSCILVFLKKEERCKFEQEWLVKIA